MTGNKKIKTKWLSLAAVIFILLSMMVQPAFAASLDFENLSGSAREGKVKISVESFQETDGRRYETPELVRIKAGDKTSYIPVITNKGSECKLRLRVFAKTETQKINILKYCYGWEDNWTYKDDWFYYKKPFEENERVEICQGFDFPQEWQWRVSNVMGITVEAEAVADEEPGSVGAVKTGDDTEIWIWALITAASFVGIEQLIRRRNGDKDI